MFVGLWLDEHIVGPRGPRRLIQPEWTTKLPNFPIIIHDSPLQLSELEEVFLQLSFSLPLLVQAGIPTQPTTSSLLKFSNDGQNRKSVILLTFCPARPAPQF